MKRTLIAAVAMTAATAAQADNDGCAVIKPNSDGWAAVRSGPSTEFSLTRKLLPGRTVYLERTAGNWHYISTIVTKHGTTEEVTGWMHGSLLRSVECKGDC